MINPDAIAAIATAEGAAGVAIVRISGPDAWQIADRVVRCTGTRLSTRQAGRFFHAQFTDALGGEIIDDGIVLLFSAPASFTGEDVVELQGHGGKTASLAVLRAVLTAGARLAEPGEFTRRAFLNGRMDLTQAEAVMDLVHARSERAAQAARAQLAGNLGREVTANYTEVTEVCADVEAQLDFEAGELPAHIRGEAEAKLDHVRVKVAELLATVREGHLLRDGALVVIGGCPNAGKSSLLNALLGTSRAIVSAHAGTTRDTIEETLVLDGIPLRLMDTAGLRDAESSIEQEGVARAYQALQQADLIVYVIDASRPLSAQLPTFPPTTTNLIVVLNKTDLPVLPTESEVKAAFLCNGSLPAKVLKLSLKTGDGLEALKFALVDQLGVERQTSVHPIVTERHRAELVLADQALVRARAWLCGDDSSLVLAANELRRAAEALGRIIGHSYTNDLLDQVFSRFCVGK